MIVSLGLLKKSIENYSNIKKEKYSDDWHSVTAGMSLATATGILTLSILFLILEMVVLFYSVTIAIRCTTPGPERIVHMVLSIFFTLPYILVSALFTKCGKAILRSNYTIEKSAF